MKNQEEQENNPLPRRELFKSMAVLAGVGALGTMSVASASTTKKKKTNYLFNDSHVHLTSYVQKGTTAKSFLKIMGDKVGRSTLFGLPLQQQWTFVNSFDDEPTYYLDSDAKMYYYSFVDAIIAHEYNTLTKEEKKRFDPMITGFNPNDMYAVEHIKRLLKMYPNTFVGLGEFSIHKEFVSSKIQGASAVLMSKSLNSILNFAGEAGLPVIFHNDIDTPMNNRTELPSYAKQMYRLLKQHKDTTIIWAHTGLGRTVSPRQRDSIEGSKRNPSHLDMIERTLENKELKNLHYDISWDVVAKYIIATPESLQNAARIINKYPDRFLFGTDMVAPKKENYFEVYEMYAPLFKKLTPEASKMLRLTNYERIFDKARVDVANWERAHKDEHYLAGIGSQDEEATHNHKHCHA